MRNPAYLRGAMAFGLASVVGLAIFLSSLQMVPLLILGSGLLARLVVIPGLLVGSLMVGVLGAAFLKLGWRAILGFGLGFLVGESFLWVVFLLVFPSQPKPLQQLLYVPIVLFVGLGFAGAVGTAFVRFSWKTILIGARAFGLGSAAGGLLNSLFHLLIFSFFPAYLSWSFPGSEGDLMSTLAYSAMGLVFVALPHALAACRTFEVTPNGHH